MRLWVNIALLAFVALGMTSCKSRKYTWNTEEEYFKLALWSDHVKAFKKVKMDPNRAVVFIGDSMTEGYDLTKFYPGFDVVNQGISGDFTSGVLKRLDIAFKLKPAAICLMIGINDILKKVPMSRVLDQYGRILTKIHEALPGVPVFILSNLPTTNMGGSPELNAAVVRQVQELNAFLILECEKQNFTFVNLYPNFSDHDTLLKDYTYDGLHLNDPGYSTWTSQLLPLLQSVLKP